MERRYRDEGAICRKWDGKIRGESGGGCSLSARTAVPLMVRVCFATLTSFHQAPARRELSKPGGISRRIYPYRARSRRRRPRAPGPELQLDRA